jgi:hypothetical protein
MGNLRTLKRLPEKLISFNPPPDTRQLETSDRCGTIAVARFGRRADYNNNIIIVSGRYFAVCRGNDRRNITCSARRSADFQTIYEFVYV